MPETITAGLTNGATRRYFAAWLPQARSRVRGRTYQGYEGLIRLYALPALGDLPLREVTPLDLQALYASLQQDRTPPISAGTVLNLHLVLTTQALGQAVAWGILERSPATTTASRTSGGRCRAREQDPPGRSRSPPQRPTPAPSEGAAPSATTREQSGAAI